MATTQAKTSIRERLAAIQGALKAPKSQFNKFGGYAYRKAEDILEAVKPLLQEQGCTLTCTDEVVLIGDRYYVRAEAVLADLDGNEIRTQAFAREEDEKKGMDGSQITGASSSYARKYALNGLLCIDDTADSDTTNVGDGKTEKKAPAKKAAAVAAAPAPAPQQQPYTPLPEEQYWATVRAHATGRKTKRGGSLREAWIQATHAGKAEIELFDHAVDNYIAAVNGGAAL